ncbi:hypothetical protein WAI453_005488 [Rhynchosporium graminicola]
MDTERPSVALSPLHTPVLCDALRERRGCLRDQSSYVVCQASSLSCSERGGQDIPELGSKEEETCGKSLGSRNAVLIGRCLEFGDGRLSRGSERAVRKRFLEY